MSAGKTAINRPERVTLHVVAAAAGVSKSTVARILNGESWHLDSETARKVRQVADELGYIRDATAASLRRGKSNTIGLVVTRLIDPPMAMLYEEIARICGLSGRVALVAGTNDDPASTRTAVQTLLGRGVDGLVVTTLREGDTLSRELTDRNIAHVLAIRSDGESPSSIADDLQGGYLATKHLLELGHRRIGFIAGPAGASTAQRRFAGFERALAEAGVKFDPALMAPSSFGFESGAQAAMRLMRLDPRPTAIFAVNDTTAIGAMQALHQLGLKVPDDVSVMGYTDIPIAAFLPVPLSTIRMPYDRIAAAAIELLDSPPVHAEDRIRVATPVLVARASTAKV